MKKAPFIFLTLFIFAALSFPFYAGAYAGTITVSDISFKSGANEVFVVFDGKIKSEIKIAPGGSGRVFAITASYSDAEGARLTDISLTSADLTGEEQIVSTKEINALKDGMVRAYVWNALTFEDAAFVKQLNPYAEDNETEDYEREVNNALAGFEELFGAEALDWLASLYSPNEGGFYYSVSARDYEGFAPDIESTSQAYDILVGLGVIPGGATDEVPTEFKEKNIDFMKTRQSSDGYFYDKQFGSNVSDSKRERNYSQAMGALNRYGITPLFPPPEAHRTYMVMRADGAGGYLSSIESFSEWLDSCFEENDAYTAGHRIASSVNAIKNKPDYLKITMDFLKAKQNRNGFWYGKGETEGSINYAAVNGAMKISSVFVTAAEPIPNTGEIFKNTIDVILSDETPSYITSVWNPLILLNNAKGLQHDFAASESGRLLKNNLISIIRKSIDKAKVFKKSDGGFSYNRYGSSPVSQGVNVGLGLAEGDVNATYMGTQGMMSACYSLAGKRNEMPAFERYRDRFFEKAFSPENREREKISIKDKLLYESDFSFGIPSECSCVAKSGSITAEEGVLSLKTVRGENTSVRFKITAASAETYAYEVTFSVEKASGNELFYNSVGDTALQWCIIKKGATFSLSHREKDLGLGTVFAEELVFGKKYVLRIEYSPQSDGKAKTRYCLDGRLMCETDSYFGMEQWPAVKSINRCDFSAFLSSEAVLNIDRVAMYVF